MITHGHGHSDVVFDCIPIEFCECLGHMSCQGVVEKLVCYELIEIVRYAAGNAPAA